jgi:hypothetical protein
MSVACVFERQAWRPGALFFAGTERAMDNTEKPRARSADKRRKAKERNERICELLSVFERQAVGEETKISVSDYVRLLQLKREFDGDKPKDIIVTWVDSLPEKKNTEE